MARVPYPDPKTLSAETQDMLGKLPKRLIFTRNPARMCDIVR